MIEGRGSRITEKLDRGECVCVWIGRDYLLVSNFVAFLDTRLEMYLATSSRHPSNSAGKGGRSKKILDSSSHYRLQRRLQANLSHTHTPLSIELRSGGWNEKWGNNTVAISGWGVRVGRARNAHAARIFVQAKYIKMVKVFPPHLTRAQKHLNRNRDWVETAHNARGQR